MNQQTNLSPNDQPPEIHRHLINDFWHDLELSGDFGRTTGEALAPLRDQVTECLAQGNLSRAGFITARAMALIAGSKEY